MINSNSEHFCTAESAVYCTLWYCIYILQYMWCTVQYFFLFFLLFQIGPVYVDTSGILVEHVRHSGTTRVISQKCH